MDKQVENSRSTKFVKDLGIYAVGNIGSKLITFLMVPLYTYFVPDTSDFGYYDIYLTACFLLMPFLTLQLRDGSFRFLMDAGEKATREQIVSFTLRALSVTIVLGLIIAFSLSLFCQIKYLWYVYGLLLSLSLQDVLSQILRGLGHNKAFAVVGILTAIGIGLFSIVFVAWLGMGIKGIFIANILARILSLVIVEVKIRLITSHINLSCDVQKVGRSILRYSLPLLPGSLFWWLSGSSDRWFIMHYLGLDVNGVYAVAIRFTGIITTLSIIFYQAWQETSLQQYESEDRNSFFTNVFNGYIYILAFIVVVYSFVLKICYGWLVAPGYQASVAYIYPLALSAMLFSVVAFFDMGYQCAKDTIRTLPAIVLSALVNVILNFLLVPLLNVWGAILTLLVTNTTLVAYRWHDMHRYFRLSVFRSSLGFIGLVLVSAVPYFLSSARWQDWVYLMIAVTIFIWYCPTAIKEKILHKTHQMHNKLQ